MAAAEVQLRGGKAETTKTDADGYYYFDTVKEPGEYKVYITSERCVGITDFRTLPQVNLAEGTQVVRNFTLARGGQLKLQVLSADGKPIADASVYSRLLTDEPHRVDGDARTDNTGWVTLGGLRPSSETRIVGVTSNDYAVGRLLLVIDKPDVVTQQLRLEKGVAVTGKAICSDGKPATGWRINALPTWFEFGRYPMGAVVGKDGTFKLEHVAPERYKVSVSIPTGEGSSMMVTLKSEVPLPPAEGTLALKIDRPSPGTEVSITGRIQYSGKKLEKGFHVSATAVGGPFAHFDCYVTPGQNDFHLEHLPPGVYRLEFASSEIESVTLPRVTAPAKDLEVKIHVRGKLQMTGAVTRAGSGEPVVKFRVMVNKLRSLGGPNYVQEKTWHEFQDKDGKFAIDVVGPGEYSATVEAAGLGVTQTNPITIDGKSNTPLRVKLGGSDQEVSGTIVNQRGRPIDGAVIVPLAGPALYHGVTPALVGEAGAAKSVRGKLTVALLTPQHETLKVSHPDYAPQTVELDADIKSGAKPLKIVLTEGATLRGTVYGPRGEPGANVTLHVSDSQSRSRGSDDRETRLATVVTDAAGQYEVKLLPPVLVNVQHADKWNALGVTQQQIKLEEGQTQTLDFGGPTRLTARLLVNGQPLAGARIQLCAESPFSNEFRALGRTDDDGVVALFGMPPGEKTLYFALEGDRNKWVPAGTFKITRTTGALGDIQCVTGTVTVKTQGAKVPPEANVSILLSQYSDVWTSGQSAGQLRRRQSPEEPAVFDGVPVGKYLASAYLPDHLQAMTTVEVTAENPNPTVTIDVPQGTASLSGKFDLPQEDVRRHNLKLWSADNRQRAYFRPGMDGAYRLENLPAGEYHVKQHDTRDAATLATITLAAGEAKTLDITPELFAHSPPQGFAVVNTYTAGGVPLVGCEAQLPSGSDIVLQSSQSGRMSFVGKPGKYPIVLSYPGFRPLTATVKVQLPTPGGQMDPDSLVSYKLEEAE